MHPNLRNIFLALFSLLWSLNLYGQSSDTLFIHADSIKDGNMAISGAWRYHPGDDSTWSDPMYDVSSWDTLNPHMDMDEMADSLWTGIGWFRKVIAVDTSLLGSMIALRLDHYGASQIFLNGKELYEYGRVSALPDSEQMRKPTRIPLAVQLDSMHNQIIAVRYSNHKAIEKAKWFKRWFRRAGFSLQASGLNRSITSAVGRAQVSNALNFGIAGLFLSLSLLYFFLFIFFARRRENLFYALFNLFISVVFISSMLLQLSVPSLTFYYIVRTFSAFSISYIFLSYLGFLYSIFYKKFPRQFWFFLSVALLISASIFTYIPRQMVNYPLFVFIMVATLEGLRVIIVALKQKKDNAWVIGAGVIVFVGFIITLFVLGIVGRDINSIVGVILFFVGILSLPISMSIFLARNIALTNKQLEKQIDAVKDLTQKQIEQERHAAELKLQAELAEAENARKSKELEEARQLQLSMLPEEVPRLPDIEISVYMKTATEVGGDYYDFSVAKDGTLNIAFGDATGHGMQSGTLVSMMKALFTSDAARSDIQSFFEYSSRAIKQIRLGRLLMAFTLLKIKDHKFSMSSAGMPPVYIYRHDSGEIEEVALEGMPLGAIKDFRWQVKEGTLAENDSILLVTDGLPELTDGNEEQFGYARIYHEFSGIAALPADEMIRHFVEKGEEWTKSKKPDDDLTIMVIKMKNKKN